MKPITELKCVRCKETKPIKAFGRDRSRANGYDVRCKECKITLDATYNSVHRVKRIRTNKKWLAKHPGVMRKLALERQYNLPWQVYNALADGQGFACAICRMTKEDKAGKGKTLVVDHCHTSNNVRALLCGTCNRGLGYFYDNPSLLEAAAAYIRFHNREGKVEVSPAVTVPTPSSRPETSAAQSLPSALTS